MRRSVAIAMLLLVALVSAADSAETAARTDGGAPRVDIAAEAAAIDALVEAGLAREQSKPNADAGDTVFVRRAHLDIVGRIPTPEETAAFAAASGPERRRDLVARLLRSPGAVHREFTWWADLLRVESNPQKRLPGEPYIDWLKGALRANLPYDAMVREMLTAHGPATARGNGATGFWVRDAGMPLDHMAWSVQAFLGTRISCAQCHDHPFAPTTRMEFMRMAAFTAATRTGPDPELVKALRRLARDDGQPSQAERQALQRIGQSVRLEVLPPAKSTIPLPKDWQYADGKAGKPVTAHTLFGGDATPARGEDPRLAYARWMTSPDNPRFAATIANRLWKKVMGHGLVEPADDLGDGSTASDPALLRRITALMVATGFDLRAFQEVLYATRTYQRAACAPPETGAPCRFPGPVQRRLSAEQIWDSLLTLAVPAIDERHGGDAEARYAAHETFAAKSPQELWEYVQSISASIGRRNEIQARLAELAREHGGQRNLRRVPEAQELRRELGELADAAKALGFPGGKYGQKRNEPETDPRWRGLPRDWVRAAELPQPTPPGHFLRDFGQSDREVIDNGNRQATVPQALTLLNGIVDQQLARPESALMRRLEPIADARERVRAAVGAVLCREPAAHELAALVDAGFGRRDRAADLAWVLVNAREFLFTP